MFVILKPFELPNKDISQKFVHRGWVNTGLYRVMDRRLKEKVIFQKGYYWKWLPSNPTGEVVVKTFEKWLRGSSFLSKFQTPTLQIYLTMGLSSYVIHQEWLPLHLIKLELKISWRFEKDLRMRQAA